VWSHQHAPYNFYYLFLIFQGEEQVTAEFLAGKIPEIVYKKAIQSIPGTVKYEILLISFTLSWLNARV